MTARPISREYPEDFHGRLGEPEVSKPNAISGQRLGGIVEDVPAKYETVAPVAEDEQPSTNEAAKATVDTPSCPNFEPVAWNNCEALPGLGPTAGA